MASALAESSRSCPELVYAALQRRDEVFAPFLEEFLESKDSNRDEKDSSNREGFREGSHATTTPSRSWRYIACGNTRRD